MPHVLNETVISRAEAACMLRCRENTATRFVREGDWGGVRLEAAPLGEGWVTSVEAVHRFANRRVCNHRGRAAAYAHAARP